MRYVVLAAVFFYSGYVGAHEWTPTYPTLRNSYAAGILTTRMELFNSRQNVSYYQIEVFDSSFMPVPFATAEKIINMNYLERKSIDVFIRDKDRKNAVYICSKSKLLARGSAITSISSRICSKIK